MFILRYAMVWASALPEQVFGTLMPVCTARYSRVHCWSCEILGAYTNLIDQRIGLKGWRWRSIAAASRFVLPVNLMLEVATFIAGITLAFFDPLKEIAAGSPYIEGRLRRFKNACVEAYHKSKARAFKNAPS